MLLKPSEWYGVQMQLLNCHESSLKQVCKWTMEISDLLEIDQVGKPCIWVKHKSTNGNEFYLTDDLPPVPRFTGRWLPETASEEEKRVPPISARPMCGFSHVFVENDQNRRMREQNMGKSGGETDLDRCGSGEGCLAAWMRQPSALSLGLLPLSPRSWRGHPP